MHNLPLYQVDPLRAALFLALCKLRFVAMFSCALISCLPLDFAGPDGPAPERLAVHPSTLASPPAPAPHPMNMYISASKGVQLGRSGTWDPDWLICCGVHSTLRLASMGDATVSVLRGIA